MWLYLTPTIGRLAQVVLDLGDIHQLIWHASNLLSIREI